MEKFQLDLPDYSFCLENNKTNIIFDNRFKMFINELREHINNKFDRYDTNNIFEKQDYTLDYVKKNKDKITLRENKLNIKPDMFCICICLFLDINFYSSFNELNVESILKQLYYNINHLFESQPIHDINNFEKSINIYNNEKMGECCCSKKGINPKNIFFCINKNYSCFFGICCIHKTNIHTKQIINDKIKKRKQELKIKNKQKTTNKINNIKPILEHKLSCIFKKKQNKINIERCNELFKKINSESKILKYYSYSYS
jgi:hypothetical protein